MLGDTAVAVIPNDERYHLHRQKALAAARRPQPRNPHRPRRLGQPEFGTGAVKVTPAHDPNDFALGQRHNLPSINIMDETAHINAARLAYTGLDRYVARKRIVADLEARACSPASRITPTPSATATAAGPSSSRASPCSGFAVKIQPARRKSHRRRQARCRSPPATATSLHPEQYEKTYLEWMDNIHDWCISRQLWWGHRIPPGTAPPATPSPSPARRSHRLRHTAAQRQITQETDVLDTWFSSGLLPVSVFGWPGKTPGAPNLEPLGTRG
jgi:valyl-tRNA synthetase